MGNIMRQNLSYQQQKKIDFTLKIRERLKQLPSYVGKYARGIEPLTSDNTRYSYLNDIQIFFHFLCSSHLEFVNTSMKDISLEHLEGLTIFDIEEYQEYLKFYCAPSGQWYQNGERGVARKIASLRSFFYYLYQHDLIMKNPMLKVTTPKIREKEIIHLDEEEISALLNYIKYAKIRYEKKKKRDLAITTLLLGTGIRVSECVGLDMDDVDFINNRIRVIRKGGNEMYVYFGEEVQKALQDYLQDRTIYGKENSKEKALFLSRRKKRISVDAIEELIKNYSKQVITRKKITPHKLRSTYGTKLYEETGDIYLVADALGHKDINTTSKHYAAIQDRRRREAAKAFKIQKEPS